MASILVPGFAKKALNRDEQILLKSLSLTELFNSLIMSVNRWTMAASSQDSLSKTKVRICRQTGSKLTTKLVAVVLRDDVRIPAVSSNS